MDALQQVEKILSSMTGSEKAQFLRRVVSELSDDPPGIERTAGVCGGDPCIAGTRIPVWVLEQYRRLGSSEADLLRAFPALHAEDLVNAWAYIRSHSAEIEQQILDNEAA